MNELNTTDLDALEALANGADPLAHLTRVTTAEESVDEFEKRMNAALKAHQQETVMKYGKLADPTLYFDLHKPLAEQNPVAFLSVLSMAFGQVYVEAVAFVQKAMMTQLQPVVDEVKKAMAEHEASKSDG